MTSTVIHHNVTTILGPAISEVSLLKNYFDKNHAYRTGTLRLPYRALIYIDDDWVETSSSNLDSAVGTVFSNRKTITRHATQGYPIIGFTVTGMTYVGSGITATGVTITAEAVCVGW